LGLNKNQLFFTKIKNKILKLQKNKLFLQKNFKHKIMDAQQLNIDKIFKHWIESSDEDFKTMNVLFDSKSYNWALFMGHICIEKLLKAYFVKKNENHAPFTHNLYRLAELCEIEINEEFTEWLFKITTFNINARYDDYKKEFYAICTENFTKEWIEKIKILQQWIKQML